MSQVYSVLLCRNLFCGRQSGPGLGVSSICLGPGWVVYLVSLVEETLVWEPKGQEPNMRVEASDCKPPRAPWGITREGRDTSS